MTRPGIEPESTASVADALSTRPLNGFNNCMSVHESKLKIGIISLGSGSKSSAAGDHKGVWWRNPQRLEIFTLFHKNNSVLRSFLIEFRIKRYALNSAKHTLNKQRWSPQGRPWPRGRPRGQILKSLALASKVKSLALALASRPQVLEN